MGFPIRGQMRNQKGAKFTIDTTTKIKYCCNFTFLHANYVQKLVINV